MRNHNLIYLLVCLIVVFFGGGLPHFETTPYPQKCTYPGSRAVPGFPPFGLPHTGASSAKSQGRIWSKEAAIKLDPQKETTQKGEKKNKRGKTKRRKKGETTPGSLF